MSAGNLSSDQFQLTMFEPAHKLMDGGVGSFNPGDLVENEPTYSHSRGEYTSRDQTASEGWEMKTDEAYESGLVDSVERGGVRKPVVLSAVNLPAIRSGYSERPALPRGNIMDGHHRVAAANEIDPNMEVPVTWRSERKFGPSSPPFRPYEP